MYNGLSVVPKKGPFFPTHLSSAPQTVVKAETAKYTLSLVIGFPCPKTFKDVYIKFKRCSSGISGA